MAEIIMVTSGKGGTGKSTMSTYIATELALMGHKTLLVELDVGLRSIDIITGTTDQAVYDISDVLSGRCDVKKALITSPYTKNLYILPAPYQAVTINFNKFKNMVDSIFKDFEFIIIDTAAGMGQAFQVACTVSHSAIIVATPDAISIRDARLVSQYLYQSKIHKVRLILNKFSKQNFKYSGFEDIDAIIDTTSAQLLGIMPYSQEIAVHSIQGGLIDTQNVEKQVLNAIAQRIKGITVKTIIQ